MKILVCGSRRLEVKDRDFVFKTLDDIISKEQYFSNKKVPNESLEIISGNNPKGADWLAERWAKENNLSLKLFPADWNNTSPKKPEGWGNGQVCILKKHFHGDYNSLAGYLRNQEMANYCVGEICIAFDAEEKKGSTETRDMIKRAKKAWMKVYHVKCHDTENVTIKVYNEGLQKDI